MSYAEPLLPKVSAYVLITLVLHSWVSTGYLQHHQLIITPLGLFVDVMSTEESCCAPQRRIWTEKRKYAYYMT
jgi:hypothetical protein